MTHESSSFHERNRAKMVAFFERGDTCSQKLGFELEHVLLHARTNEPVSYSEPRGVHDILKRLAPAYDRELLDGDDVIGLVRDGQTITIEPAGQLEISAGPFARVGEIEAAYAAFRSQLDPIMDEFSVVTPLLGYNPSACARDLELIPKYRYECMTKFLGAQAYEGICMMRGTCSLQISVDFHDEADAIKKLRVAQKLAPILSLISDNSPVFEREKRPCRLVRTMVWARMNQDRVGTVPGSLERGFSFVDYADYILSREAILVPDANEPSGWRYVGNQTFEEIYAEREMSVAEIEHALSMVWPDARLKNFVEIRPADAMPIEYCLGYTALVQALFYNPSTLDELDSMLSDVSENDVRQAKDALMETGYDAQVYGRPVSSWVGTLFELAEGVLGSEERAYLEPLGSLVSRRVTLADLA